MPRPVVYGPPAVAILDLPQLREGMPAHQPLAAVHAVPWPGRVAAWTQPGRGRLRRWRRRSAGRRGWGGWSRRSIPGRPRASTSATSRSSISPIGTLASVTDLALFAGANALAVEAAPGVWEVLQAGVAELIAPGRYRLSRLLRGQRGTEGAIGSPAPAGARVVVLDEALAPLPVAEAALGLEANWRFGPASKPVADRSYRAARASRPRASACGRSRSAMSSSRGARRASPAISSIAWTRRSRALAADSWTAAEVPLAEEREAYEVEILDGATVRPDARARPRPASPTPPPSSSPTGARCSVPATRSTIRIFQLSALVGRGAPTSVTLQF